MKNFFSKYGRYIFIFLFFFLAYEFIAYPNLYGDPIANYMFSHAIVIGEVPYLDFNTISTPLYAFVMAIGLLLWDNYLMFIIEQCILVTIMFYFLYQLYGKKSYLLLLTICLSIFFAINPTYNFLAFLMLIVLLYLEQEHSNKDYLIGIVIGLAILSKHTIGILFIIPSIIFYYKDVRKLCKRLIGVVIPCFIFLLYLISNKALSSFINLCFLGLFDFTSKNGKMLNIFFFISIFFLFWSIFFTIKHRNDICNYYLVLCFSFVIPLFDFQHFSIYLLCFLIQILSGITLKNDKCIAFLSIVSSFIFCLLLGCSYFKLLNPKFNNGLDKFEYILNSKNNYYNIIFSYSVFDSYDDALILSYSKGKYDISNDYKIDYFDILMYGNYGYNGSNKMIEQISLMHDKYIIVDMAAYQEKSINSQFDKKIVKYVIDNCLKIDSRGDFDIYYKK